MRRLFVSGEAPIGCVVSERDVSLLQVTPGVGVAAAARAPRAGESVCDALRNAYREAPFRGRELVTCLPNDLVIFRRLLLPPMPTEDLAAAAAWRLAKEVNQNLEDLVTDYYDLGDVFEDVKHKREIIAVGAAADDVRDHLAPFARCQLIPIAVDTIAGAIARCVTSSERGGSCLVIDLHGGAAHVMVAEAGVPRFIHVLRRLESHRLLDGAGGHDGVCSVADVRQMVDQLAREINICAHYLSDRNSSTSLPSRACVIGAGAVEQAIASSLAKASTLEFRPVLEYIEPCYQSSITELEREHGAGWLLLLGLALYTSECGAVRRAA